MSGLTLADLAAAKGLTVELLASFGVTEVVQNGESHVRIPYKYPNGQVAATKRRLKLEDPGRFQWPKGKPTMPYALDLLEAAPADVDVVYVEGESDVWTLVSQGFVALGIPGAKTWKPGYGQLRPGQTPFVWQESGEAGAAFVKAITHDRPDARVIVAPSAELKDPNALYQSDPTGFRDVMRALMAAARSPQQEREAARDAEAAQALEESHGLLDDRHLFSRIRNVIRQRGYAGDPRPPIHTVLAGVSAIGERPNNVAYIGTSASGKNASVDAGTALFPPETFHVIAAGSARSVIYDNDADYEHKVVIFAEADSIPEDGAPASAVRALATDGVMAYDVVVRDEETGRFRTQHIRKAGPTGLITTSTKPLPPQLSTRMLTVTIADTPAQTRAVMLAHAAKANGEAAEVDVSPFVAAHRWLRLAGDREVAVTFARTLAELVSSDQVRMRRDFKQLIGTVQSFAILYQRQRARDSRGRIVATFDDYSRAYWLLRSAFVTAVSGGITEPVREVAAAVRALHAETDKPVMQTAVAARLGIATSTTHFRLKGAMRHSLVLNRETRKGHAALLVPGEVDVTRPEGLPSPARLRAAYQGDSIRIVASHPSDVPENGHLSDANGDATGLASLVASLEEPDLSTNPTSDGAAIQRFEPNPAGRAAESAEAEMVRAALDSGFAVFTCPSTRGCPSAVYWIRGDGEPMCSKCHPDPAALAADWERRRAEREVAMD